MGVKYSAGFDVRKIRDGQTDTDYSFTLTLTGAGSGVGYTPITIAASDFATFGWSYYLHGYAIGVAENHQGNTVFPLYSTSTFAAALGSIITSKMASVGVPWVGAITVDFSPTTNRYTIERTAGTFTFALTWGEAASRFTMGFSVDQTAASTHAGDLTPLYWIDATHDGRSLDLEGDFEPGEIAGLAISDSATAFAGVSRSTSPKYRSWFQHFEPVAKVFKGRIETTTRWTFEHLFEHCRCEFPFVVDDDVEEMVCVFLPEGSSFRGKQRPGGPGDDVHMHIPFNVWHAADVVGE